MRIFRELNDAQGITIMLVTHEPDIAGHAKRIGELPRRSIRAFPIRPINRSTQIRSDERCNVPSSTNVRLAVASALRNKSRSLLTMLGIVIGVAAVIVTVAIGVGSAHVGSTEHQRARERT